MTLPLSFEIEIEKRDVKRARAAAKRRRKHFPHSISTSDSILHSCPTAWAVARALHVRRSDVMVGFTSIDVKGKTVYATPEQVLRYVIEPFDAGEDDQVWLGKVTIPPFIDEED